MKKKVLEHFRANDPKLFSYAQQIGKISLTPSDDHFYELCDTIVSQQLSGKAAATIFSRFLALFPQKRLTPQKLLTLSDEALRSTGISRAKAMYLKDLARRVQEKSIILHELPHMEDEAVITALTQVKGIGRWTAEMFLMFSLAREDVFSFGDLGLKKGIQKVYGLKHHPTEKQMNTLSKKWKPYRTYAARVLWRALEL